MLVAKKPDGSTLEIVKQFLSKSNFIYRFQLTYVGERSFFTGNQYTTKELILADAYSVALSKLCGFKNSDIVAGIQNSDNKFITEEQKTALYIALNALQSGSEQQQIAAFYINQLIEKV